MSDDVVLYVRSAAVLVLVAVNLGCVSKEEKIKALANGVRGGIAGSQGHFVAEWESICAEMPSAQSVIVPPVGKVCSRGCRCASTAGAEQDPRTIYDCDQWHAREWELVKFAGRYDLAGSPSREVYFHHQVRWHRTDQGCRLEFTVYGDLDEDGVYSTYISTIETTPDGAEGNLPKPSLLWE